MKQGPQFTIHEIKANSVIYIYTFIHKLFTIEKSQNLLASRTGNQGQSHTEPEIVCCDVSFAAIILLLSFLG